jgi:hypothetical protein
MKTNIWVNPPGVVESVLSVEDYLSCKSLLGLDIGMLPIIDTVGLSDCVA